MILSTNRLVDGQLSFERGEETHKAPARVPRNQSCLLINATTRQDFIAPRPGWLEVALGWETALTAANFQNGLFQGAGDYTADNGDGFIFASISGRLFCIDMAGAVRDVTPVSGANSSTRKQAWFKQAEQFLVVQDGQSAPIIWDGTSSRRSDVTGAGGVVDGKPRYEVPGGTCMEYVNGRLWVALPGGHSFVAGDGAYSQQTGTAPYRYRDSVLRFTENAFLTGGGAFAVPANMGPISAMRAPGNLDTSLGQGPLQVFTLQGCFSVAAPFDRTQWVAMTYPIQTVSLLGDGAVSQDSVVTVNGDLWFRAENGVRSFFIARRNFSEWGNRAQSHEVGKHIDHDDKALLRYCSGVHFDDRLLLLCQPQDDRTHGTYWRGSVVLDFHPLTSIIESQDPSWDGLWTGVDILKLVTVKDHGITRCFAFVLAPLNANHVRTIQVWELSRESRWNYDWNKSRSRTTTIIESPRLDFGNKLEQKLLDGAELWIDKLAGEVDFKLYYRPDDYPCWIFWRAWRACAKIERCADEVSEDGCLTGLNLKPQYRTRMSALKPPDECLGFINRPARLGYGFQWRLEQTGYAELCAVRLLATRIVEPEFGSCLGQGECEELICCAPDDASESQPIPDDREQWGDDYDYYYDYGAYGYSYSYGYGYWNAHVDVDESHNTDNPLESDPNYELPGQPYDRYNGWIVWAETLDDGTWLGWYPSNYGVLKVNAEVGDDVTIAQANFWKVLMESEWDQNMVGVPYTQRILVWSWVDPCVTNIGDLNAKMVSGNTTAGADPGEQYFSPGAYWRLEWWFK